MMPEVKQKTAWSAWINQKYDEFRRGKVGHAAGVTAFGRQFGASHQVVLAWLEDGSHPPISLDYINALIDTYGEDALEPLGIERLPRRTDMDKKTRQLVELVEATPEDKQDQLIKLIEDFLAFAGFRRVK